MFYLCMRLLQYFKKNYKVAVTDTSMCFAGCLLLVECITVSGDNGDNVKRR